MAFALCGSPNNQLADAAGQKIKPIFRNDDATKHFSDPQSACQDFIKRASPGSSLNGTPADEGDGQFRCFYKEKDGTERDISKVSRTCPEHAHEVGTTCECDDSYTSTGTACSQIKTEGETAGGTSGESAHPADASNTPNRNSDTSGDRHQNGPDSSRKCPIIYYDKQLASGEEKGSLAGRGKGYGVYEGHVCKVPEPVAVKVFPKSAEGYFRNEMESAKAAAATTLGPKFHGQVNAGPDKLAFAMEKVIGEFLDQDTDASRAARKSVTAQTAQDVRQFGREILAKDRYTQGDLQGLVSKGRWRPIDFGSYEKLPTEPSARQEALRRHNDAVEFEAILLEKIAKENSRTSH